MSWGTRGLTGALGRETSPNSFDDFPSGWHDAEYCQSPAIDDGLTIDEHLVLAISAVYHVDLDAEVASQLRRHTDGVQTRHSVRAITNGNSGHCQLL